MSLSKESKKKLRAVRDAILAEPEFYDQNLFPNEGDCGTTCCIAGWAVWLDDPSSYLGHVQSATSWFVVGARALSLQQEEALKLFVSSGNWPKPFALAYRRARTSRGCAAIAARRIDHFIATDGVE